MEMTIVYWGYIGLMKKKMETIILYSHNNMKYNSTTNMRESKVGKQNWKGGVQSKKIIQ